MGTEEHGMTDSSARSSTGKAVTRGVDDFDKFTKEKFIENGAKEFVDEVYLIKVEHWINKMNITFKAMQVILGKLR